MGILDRFKSLLKLTIGSFNTELRERQRVEAALRTSDAKYRSIFENAIEGIFQTTPDGRFINVSPSFARIYGYDSPNELIQSVNDIGREIYVHPQDRARFVEQVNQSGIVTEFEQQVRRKDGSIGWVSISARPVRNESGELVYLHGFVIDITERKHSEEVLRQANLVIENSPVVLFRWKAAEGWPVEMVSKNVSQFGYTPEELLSWEILFAAMVHPEDLDRVTREVQEYSASGTDRFQQEYRIIAKDGAVHWVDDRTLVERDAGGQITSYQGIVIDITERKRAEETHAELSRLLDESLHEMYIFDADTLRFIEVNSVARKNLGYAITELHSMTPVDLKPEFNMSTFRKLIEPLCSGSTLKCVYETKHQRKDHSLYDVEVHLQKAIFEGRPVFAAATIDITERKQAEEALRESMRQLRTVVNGAPVVLYSFDRHGVFTLSEGKGLLGLGIKPGEIVGRTIFEVYGDQPEAIAALLRALSGETFTVELSFAAGGTFEVSHIAMRDDAGEYAGTIGVLVDITERKRAEEALRSLLEEKDSLLKEVHHRVKNNLQVVSSLLKLETRKIHNPEVQNLLRDTRNRVHSMALLHETLYQSDNLAKVSFPQYVKNVCNHVARSYASGTGNIRLRHEIDDVSLNLDLAISAGLIITELVSNAFKHAFPSHSEGEVLVELHAAPGDRLILRVSDNGIGMDPEMSLHDATSLGMLLVHNLTRQLDGQLTFSGVQGTVFEIEFPAASS